jgi:hypothetical protein
MTARSKPSLTTEDSARSEEARVYIRANIGGQNLVRHCIDDRQAYALWLTLDRGVFAALRGAGNKTPVYPHDYVDRG